MILLAPTPRGGPGVTFPAQLQISGNGAGWHESGIDRWIANPAGWRAVNDSEGPGGKAANRDAG
ncbi:MAG: hypothetical protein ACI4XG_19835 [Bradyrhizobium sp.]